MSSRRVIWGVAGKPKQRNIQNRQNSCEPRYSSSRRGAFFILPASKLAQAVAEIGRIDKTIHILTSIDDESKRRRTLTQLNRGEDRHSLARAVFHGKRGELRQHYREGQEDQPGALGLVVNVIALWNTIYMDAALGQLQSEGYSVKPEDVARLSPHMFDHITSLAATRLHLPESVAQGKLRPLRRADAPDDE